jgi:peptidoglycan/LPS O-acetylase OafA/YrhL
MPEGSSVAAPTNPPSAIHVPELDGIRGLAVLGVIVFHETVLVPATGFDHQFLRVTSLLNCGVDLFFVLSGFLITGILFDSRASAHYYRNFYARRALRIIPLYYAVLFVAFAVLPWFNHPKLEKWGHTGGLGQVWYWLFLSNWSLAFAAKGFRHGMVDLSWTLSIEEQFYLTWPLVIHTFSRRRLMQICGGLVVVSLLVRLGLVLAGQPPIRVALVTPARMDALGMGAWVALAVRGGAGFSGLVAGARWVGALAGALALGLALNPHSAGGLGFDLMQIFYPTALAAAFTSLLILAAGARGSWLSAALRGPFLTTFGVFSYALYLFHNPVQALLRDTIFRPERFPTLFGSPLPGQLVFYVVATVPAVVLAWLSWHLYEKPWLSLKRFFPASDRPPAPPPHEPAPALDRLPAGHVLGAAEVGSEGLA